VAKFIALYKKPQNVFEFEKRYFEDHLPLANKIPGLRKLEISRMAESPGGECEYHLMAELYFEDMTALQTAMSSPEGQAAAADVMSFAKDIVTMMIAEVVEKTPVCAG